jgi:hypothetical protein
LFTINISLISLGQNYYFHNEKLAFTCPRCYGFTFLTEGGEEEA